MISQSNDMTEGFKMTEIGLLPEEWKVIRLGDAVHSMKGKKPNNLLEVAERDSIPYLTAEYFRTRFPSQFVKSQPNASFVTVDKNDVVFIWDGSNAGDVFTGLNGVLASTMVKIIPQESNLEKKYLFFFIKTKFDLFNSATTGSTIPHVNKQLFQNLLVPLPPLLEQKAITRVLSIIQQTIEVQDKIIAAARELKKSLMHYLFTYGPVAVAEAEHVSLKETEIGLVPEQWEVIKLGNIIRLFGGYAFASNQTVLSSNTQLVRMGNLYQNKLDLKRKPVFYPDDFKERYAEFVLNEGDQIISLTGTMGKEDYGFTVEIGETYQTLLLNQRVARLDQISDKVRKDYILYFLQSRRFLNYLYRIAKGTKQANLSTAAMRKLEVLCPPLREQQEIAHILSSVDRKLEAEEKRKAALQTLFKTMLHNLITGKVRVKDLEATAA
jgi:type I restriction enzyme S subunit